MFVANGNCVDANPVLIVLMKEPTIGAIYLSRTHLWSVFIPFGTVCYESQ